MQIAASSLLQSRVVMANSKFDLQPYDFLMCSYFSSLLVMVIMYAVSLLKLYILC